MAESLLKELGIDELVLAERRNARMQFGNRVVTYLNDLSEGLTAAEIGLLLKVARYIQIEAEK